MDNGKPWLIACKTTIGYGAPTKAGKASTHGSPLGGDEIKGAREKLGWPHAPFEIPAAVLDAWRAAGSRHSADRKAWSSQWAKLDAAKRDAFEHPAKARAGEVAAAVAELKKAAAGDASKRATRTWSEMALEKLVAAQPALIGGSADLTGSNNTKAKSQGIIAKGNFAGSYIHYGIREHAMAAAMNGMALYGGLIPYGGTFMVFTDYCRPAIRLSALMRQRVIYVMTHDSIGLGEDGPTHQPVEHLAALRAIPNLNVFRPADGVETAECWALAIAAGDSPSILALTRQAVSNLRTSAHRRQSLGQGRLCPERAEKARRDPARHGLGSVDRRRRCRTARQGRRARRRRLDAEFRAVPRTTRRLPRQGAGQGTPHRYRGRHHAGLARVAAARRHLHRHDRLRRLRARAQTLRALRHHGRRRSSRRRRS